jgi:hypothetical protein
MALHWWVKDATPADQVALVDLASDRVWLMRMAEVRALAQQHSSGQHHLIMVVEQQERSKHSRYLVQHFDEFLIDERTSTRARPEIAGTESSAGLDDSVSALEGEARSRMVRLRCEVAGCRFDFEAVYGAIGAGYAHVHHLRPLSEAEMPVKTTLADLAVVCANCHAMIHLGGACRPLADLIPQ